uniref:Uncharacterized protein n=1 Tax=Adineta vaga TaxID=104782 RepID=B3G4E8_ADIVA|nr:unknown [Adineta vaga]
MQKTLKKNGTGQLADQVYEYRHDYPEVYKKNFEDQGWTVDRNRQGQAFMSYRGLTEEDLYRRTHEEKFSKDSHKNKVKQSSEPLGALVCAITTPEFQKKQLHDGVRAMEKAIDTIPKDSNHKYDYKIKDYATSAFVQAIVLDHYVNRPDFVSKDFADALDHFYSHNPGISRNPAEWPADKRRVYEQEILNYYGTHRRMTDAKDRYNKIRKRLLNKSI